jgi:hypothetical protein
MRESRWVKSHHRNSADRVLIFEKALTGKRVESASVPGWMEVAMA